MNLTRKLLLVEISFFLALMLGVTVSIAVIALPEVEKIERNELIEDISRIENWIGNELSRIKTITVDWGEWDDTYRYVQTKNHDFQTSNLPLETLTDLNTDFLLIINKEKRVIWQMNTDRLADAKNLHLKDDQRLERSNPLLSSFIETDRGILQTRAGPLLIARHPILSSRAEGPSEGYIYFAKLLSTNEVTEIQKQLKINFALSKVRNNKQPPSVSFHSANRAESLGYLAVLNHQDSLLELRIEQDRPFYQQILKAAQLSVISILLIGAIGCLGTYLFLRHLLIKPLLKLQIQLDQFNPQHPLPQINKGRRQDEIGKLTASFFSLAAALKKDWGVLQEEKRDLQKASTTDPLTLLHNRRFLEDFLTTEPIWKAPSNWAFFTIDIDHFKLINDTYGHDTGDLVLKEFATLLSDSCRENDILVRSGGEEFMVICRSTDLSTAIKIAERIQKQVSIYSFAWELKLSLTCSTGFFALQISDKQDTSLHWQQLIKMSDIALYAAKNSGRNTWVGIEDAITAPLSEYPLDGEAMYRWIKEKKLTLVTNLATPEQICWQ
ncbi:diguanylate cyclase [uncultured Neptuniibacter sp.]|uniref:diguanylate cyclase n=1 Tax=uncultured Neptuniibacter sp. TaxID=502143 RepID=UPI0026074A35|nr:diguanylate cyclase [uncultured Neptuniibacter sp.]